MGKMTYRHAVTTKTVTRFERYGAGKDVSSCTCHGASALGGKRIFDVGRVHVALIVAGGGGGGEGGRRNDLLRDIGPGPAQHKAASVLIVEEFDADGVRASHEINVSGFFCHGVGTIIVNHEDVVYVNFGTVIALAKQ